MADHEIGLYFSSFREWRLASRLYWAGRNGRFPNHWLAVKYKIKVGTVTRLKRQYGKFMNHQYEVKDKTMKYGFWVMKEGKEVEVDTMEEWGKFMSSKERFIAKDEKDGVTVSTVFIGIDHNFGEGEPLLYETAIFGEETEIFERYATLAEAKEGHERALASL